jgi:DNA-binding transcriptional regulator YdaS (Cro superfamily)
MTLEEYLKEYGAARKLAEAMQVAPPEISKIKNGKKPVSFLNAALIEKATEGKVKMVKYIRADNVPQQAST